MRSHETITHLKASPEAVWRAITDAEEITRWFSPYARVEPGVGGSMRYSWDPDDEGTPSPIEIWEPNRRLRVAGDHGIVDYFIESKDGVTTLRLVHSFGDGPEWDGEYEGTKSGWPAFFRILKHNVDQHPGEPVRQISINLPVDASPDEQWTRLLGGKVDHLKAGDRYALDLPTGDHLEGTIDLSDQSHILVAVVENWNRALLSIFCERYKGKGMLSVMLGVYGPTIEKADEIEARWTRTLKEVFVCTPSS